MKYFLTTAFAVATLGVASLAAIAEERTDTKGPAGMELGDEGKLPPTGTMTDRTPDMRGPEVATPPAAGSERTDTKGPAGMTMGGEGKLPATGAMTGATPEMRAPDPAQK